MKKIIRVSKKLSDILLRTVGREICDELVRVVEGDEFLIGYFTKRKIRKVAAAVFDKEAAVLHFAEGECGRDGRSESVENVLRYSITDLLQKGGFLTSANMLRSKYSVVLSPLISADRYEKLWKDVKENTELAALLALLLQEKLKTEEFSSASDYLKARIALDGTDLLIETMLLLAGFSIVENKEMKALFSGLFKTSLRCMPLWGNEHGMIFVSE